MDKQKFHKSARTHNIEVKCEGSDLCFLRLERDRFLILAEFILHQVPFIGKFINSVENKFVIGDERESQLKHFKSSRKRSVNI